MSILYFNSYNLVSMPWKMNQPCSNVHRGAEDVVADNKANLNLHGKPKGFTNTLPTEIHKLSEILNHGHF
jgi:hypothetical protein